MGCSSWSTYKTKNKAKISILLTIGWLVFELSLISKPATAACPSSSKKPHLQVAGGLNENLVSGEGLGIEGRNLMLAGLEGDVFLHVGNYWGQRKRKVKIM
jgi:hypothetical protein